MRCKQRKPMQKISLVLLYPGKFHSREISQHAMLYQPVRSPWRCRCCLFSGGAGLPPPSAPAPPQNSITEEAKLQDLKIQECLKHEKGKGRYQGAKPCVDDQI
jgi:hypothetical protein